MREAFNTLMAGMQQNSTNTHSGGIHTSPDMRLLLLCLARLINAENVIELGYDAGYTTRALALSDARVIAIDNRSEYPEAENTALLILDSYPNAETFHAEAKEFLLEQPDGSADLIFVDDDHRADHVREEAHEVVRILRPGGVAVFHDTSELNLWQVVEEVFTGWDKLFLPARSPVNGINYGCGIVRKP